MIESNSDNRKNLVVGLSITGTDDYWALALITILSLKEQIDVTPTKVLIVTDQREKFHHFEKLRETLGCDLVRVAPRGFYQDLVPKMKGNYSTYWKFDLFNALNDNEVLMYIDVDAFAIGKLKVNAIIDVLFESEYQIAAVPSPRPVLERVAATRIKSPFDYFNAGVLFGVADSRYEEASIETAYREIIKFDSLNVFWHDQDIFNYLFRDSTFKLPYTYNIHTGYLSNNFRSPALLNGLASEDIDRNVSIAHVSGDFLLSRRYHPFKNKFKPLVDKAIKNLDCYSNGGERHYSNLRAALVRLQKNAHRTQLDYFFQCLGLRSKAFARSFYFEKLKLTLRKIKHLVMG